MVVSSAQIISRLDSQRKLQMITLFCGRHVGVPQRYTNMALHTGLYKFAQNISTNI